MSRRTLTFNDVAAADRLPEQIIDQLAAPILAKLRAIPDVSGRDAAGIPHRGMLVYGEAVGVVSAIALAAARRRLHQLRASLYVIDALEAIDVLDHQEVRCDEAA